MAEIVYSQKEKPMLPYNGFCYLFYFFNRDRSKRYSCCKERGTCNVQCTTSQDLDNITIILDGTGEHQHKVGIEEEVRKTE